MANSIIQGVSSSISLPPHVNEASNSEFSTADCIVIDITGKKKTTSSSILNIEIFTAWYPGRRTTMASTTPVEHNSVDDDPQAYVLSEVESRDIFERQILPVELGVIQKRLAALSEAGDSPTRQRRRRQPVAVFVVGQIGAGKTRTAPVIKQALESFWLERGHQPAHSEGGDGEADVDDEEAAAAATTTSRQQAAAEVPLVAHFIADTYKAYHPRYAALVAASAAPPYSPGRVPPPPSLASAATAPDARRWLRRAVDWALDHGVDVLVEAACRVPGDFVGLARACAAGGHRVEVAVLAVPAGLSRLGVLARYHREMNDRRQRRGGAAEGPARDEQKVRGKGAALLPPRLTPAKVHDASYAGLLEVARFIDESDVVDQVVVVRRAGLVAHANERWPPPLRSRGWMHQAWVEKSLLLERERALTARERALAEEDMSKLRDRATGEGSNGDADLMAQLDEIEGLLRPLIEKSGKRIEANEPSMRSLVLPGLGEDAQFNGIADLKLGFERS
jgi:UDP-N-acetylglucosamine kinase